MTQCERAPAPAGALGQGGLAFNAGFLKRLGVSAGRALVLTVKDDAMGPSLRIGDTVIVSAEQREPVAGRVYGVVIGGRLALRRFVDGMFVCCRGSSTSAAACIVVGRVVYRSGVV